MQRGSDLLSRPADATSPSITDASERLQLDEHLSLKIAELAKSLQGQHADLVRQITSDLQALRGQVRTSLAEWSASLESRWTQIAEAMEAQRVQLSGEAQANLQALRSELLAEVRPDDDAASGASRRVDEVAGQVHLLAQSVAAVEQGVADDMRRLTDSVKTERTELDKANSERAATFDREARERFSALAASMEVLRNHVTATMAASISESRAGIARADEAQASRLGRLERELSSSVRDERQAMEAHRGQLFEDVQASLQAVRSELGTFAEKVGGLAGELAELRSQIASGEAKLNSVISSKEADAAKVTALRREVRKQVTGLAKSLESYRAETVGRDDLATLERRLVAMARKVTSARSELDARLATFDALVEAVDGAVASVEDASVERLTGVARVAGTSAVAPLRSELRAIEAEVAALKKGIAQVQRQQRSAPPAAAPAAVVPAADGVTRRRGRRR